MYEGTNLAETDIILEITLHQAFIDGQVLRDLRRLERRVAGDGPGEGSDLTAAMSHLSCHQAVKG